MTRPQKTLVALAVLAAVVLALNYLAAAFINLESVKRKIQRAVSQRAGAAIEYESIDLSIFPRTHADIHRAGISIPGRVRGTAETLTIYPKIWPLFAGKLLVDELRIQSPDIAVMMSRHMETGSGAEALQDADKIKDTVQAAFASTGRSSCR